MGSGFKDWSPGDVLTAADVDGYLMRQTVMTFADASARDTALSGVLDEGMMAYLEDTNVTTYYDGSSWEDIRGLGGGSATSPGGFSSGDVLDAADLNALPGGIVGSDTVSSSVSLTTSPQTTHTATFTAVSGRKYVVIFHGLFQQNSVAGAEFRFDIEQGGTRKVPGRIEPQSTNETNSGTASVIVAGSGSTTITVECSMSTGTGTLVGSATILSDLIILDVGT